MEHVASCEIKVQYSIAFHAGNDIIDKETGRVLVNPRLAVVLLPGIAEKHNRSCSPVPAFSDIWALSFLTYGVQTEI